MELNNENWGRLLQIALILGIVILSYNDKEGWGWLVFSLLITL